METALREIVTKRPFNNVGKLFHVYGKDFPDELGGNCVKLGEDLIRVLLEKGEADEADLIDIEENDDKFHAGVMATKGGQKFYLDPGFMQLRPVCVSTLPLRASTEVPSLPLIGGKHSSMSVSRLTQNRIEVRRTVEAKPLAFNLAHTFDLRETRKGRVMNDPYGASAETANLLFRFCLDSGEVRVRKCTESGALDCLITTDTGQTHKCDLGRFSVAGDLALASVERTFNLSRRDILSHLDEGLELYRELMAV